MFQLFSGCVSPVWAVENYGQFVGIVTGENGFGKADFDQSLAVTANCLYPPQMLTKQAMKLKMEHFSPPM